MQAGGARLSTTWHGRRFRQRRLFAVLAAAALAMAVIAAGGLALENGRAATADRHADNERQLLAPFRWGDPPPPNEG